MLKLSDLAHFFGAQKANRPSGREQSAVYSAVKFSGSADPGLEDSGPAIPHVIHEQLVGSEFSSNTGTRLPKVPAGEVVYAIGDVHGRLDLLDGLLSLLKTSYTEKKRTLVFLGDYVDRGAQSAQVIDRLIHLEWDGWQTIKLRGNHEHLLLSFLEKPERYRAWRDFGAAETLLSYGVRPPQFGNDQELSRVHGDLARAIPRSHINFLNELRYFHIAGDYFFTHAGVRPGMSFEDQSNRDLLWIRKDFLGHPMPLSKVVVHGHSARTEPEMRVHRIGIDTGAYATNRLTALRLEEDKQEFISFVG